MEDVFPVPRKRSGIRGKPLSILGNTPLSALRAASAQAEGKAHRRWISSHFPSPPRGEGGPVQLHRSGRKPLNVPGRRSSGCWAVDGLNAQCIPYSTQPTQTPAIHMDQRAHWSRCRQMPPPAGPQSIVSVSPSGASTAIRGRRAGRWPLQWSTSGRKFRRDSISPVPSPSGLPG